MHPVNAAAAETSTDTRRACAIGARKAKATAGIDIIGIPALTGNQA